MTFFPDLPLPNTESNCELLKERVNIKSQNCPNQSGRSSRCKVTKNAFFNFDCSFLNEFVVMSRPGSSPSDHGKDQSSNEDPATVMRTKKEANSRGQEIKIFCNCVCMICTEKVTLIVNAKERKPRVSTTKSFEFLPQRRCIGKEGFFVLVTFKSKLLIQHVGMLNRMLQVLDRLVL